MGVIKRGILGGFSGSVGNVVGSSWKGIATMKAKPLSVANPNTAGQQEQRTKMSNVVAFAKVILTSVIKPLCDRFASGQSGFNLFVSRNIGLFDDLFPDPAGSLILSEGNVSEFGDLQITSASVGSGVAMTWDGSGSNALATDAGYFVLYNQNRNTFTTSPAEYFRSDGITVLDAPEGSQIGDTLRVWVSARRADGTQVSNTSYLTDVMAA